MLMTGTDFYHSWRWWFLGNILPAPKRCLVHFHKNHLPKSSTKWVSMKSYELLGRNRFPETSLLAQFFRELDFLLILAQVAEIFPWLWFYCFWPKHVILCQAIKNSNFQSQSFFFFWIKALLQDHLPLSPRTQRLLSVETELTASGRPRVDLPTWPLNGQSESIPQKFRNTH